MSTNDDLKTKFVRSVDDRNSLSNVGARWTKRELGRFESDDHRGTTLVVIGGVHGNEPAGLIAAMRVLDTLNAEEPTGFHGQLVVLGGNLPALNSDDENARYIDFDLNRIFTDEQIAMPEDTSVEHGQMQELLAALRSIRAQSERMIVMDLHTTSSDAPPVAVFEDSIMAREFARQMPLPIYLGFEEELDGLVIDRVTNELGSVAIVVEGGQHNDPQSIVVHEAVIWAGLHASGILPIGSLIGSFAHETMPGDVLRKAVGDQAYKVFDIRHRYAIEHDDFVICPGIVAGKKIKQEVTPIAVENGQEIVSPVRGRVFLPNMQETKRVGDDGFFIVRHIDEGWLGFSARLRKQEWIHRIIAHLPGVYRIDDAGHGSLYVDRDIAGVLKRQVFHLFGYRLIRHDQHDGGHGVVRAWNGMTSFCKAFFRGPIPGGPDENDPRFWIVRRHHLDRIDRIDRADR
ncbi:MAG: succinylglutamate desuccinylase/aspartoacylase family protein [Phycisphaerales bacterium]|nr:succinylglutamate desuccinylase/aspartoacylase family protein [Phycisphaerales bacterium]